MMLIESNDKDKTKVSCILHYMRILLKWRRERYGKYLMGKIFPSDPELENVKSYVVARLIHDYAPSVYVELDSKCTEQEMCVQIQEVIRDERKNQSIGIPKFGK